MVDLKRGKGGDDSGKKKEQAAKLKALGQTLEQIDKKFGKNAVMRLGSTDIEPVASIPTGSLSLDAALGVGGFPKGRIVEVYGPESSGKTTLALHTIANAQRLGGTAAIVDAEHALDPTYAQKLGVNLDDLLVSQPDCGEQALEITELLVRSNAVDVLVIDSVAALVPRSEIEGEMGDTHVGLQARLMSQALRKLTAVIHKSNACVIFINQIRMKIGVMFGSPETTPGGRALKFYSSVRIDIRRIAGIKKGDVVIGNRTRAKVVKNKVAPPFRLAEFDILYDRGINYLGDLIDLGVEHGVVKRSGSWLSFGETRLGQGRDNVMNLLQENPDLRAQIEQQVIPHIFPERPDLVANAVAGAPTSPGPKADAASEETAEADAEADPGEPAANGTPPAKSKPVTARSR
jgi:recombination protein RecA